MSKIKLYDTVKDKKGNRFRVTEVNADEGKLVATLRMLDKGGLQKKGRPRKVDMKTLEADYTRIDLPEVTVRKIDDLSEEEREMVKVFGKKDKDAQNENQSLTGLSEAEVEKALKASTFGGSKEPENKIIEVPDGTPHEMVEELVKHRECIEELNKTIKELRAINEELARGKKEDLEVLKAECIDLKKERDHLQWELTELKKSVSKMRQERDAEVADLRDQLGEAKAEVNAVKKRKEEAMDKYNEASDMLDSDSVAFEAILDLARIAQSVSQSLYTVSKRIEAETEGRI